MSMCMTLAKIRGRSKLGARSLFMAELDGLAKEDIESVLNKQITSNQSQSDD